MAQNQITHNAQVEAIQHTDVRGRTLLYLRIKANNQEVLINVGTQTFDLIMRLTNPDKPKYSITEEQHKKENKK